MGFASSPFTRDMMIDWKRKYGEVGYNVYGIKFMQDGKLFNLQGKEVDSKGRIIKQAPDWADPERFDEYDPELPGTIPTDNSEKYQEMRDGLSLKEDKVEKSRLEELRELLDAKGISYSPLAKEKALEKKLEAANDVS